MSTFDIAVAQWEADNPGEPLPFHACPNCDGIVRDDEPVDFGGCCSEICRSIIEDGLWPSPVGPASHDEILGWIAATEALRQPPALEES